MTLRPALLALLLALCCAHARAAVFVIGLDGTDPALAGELAAAGRLPNLAALMRDGVTGRLDTLSPLPLSSPSIWTSVATGAGEGKHGITGFVKSDGGWFRSGDRRAPALWGMASARGKSAAVAGWLLTYPAEPVNGVMVSNNYFMAVGTHSAVYPPALKLRTPRAFAFESGAAPALAARLAGMPLPALFPFMPPLGDYASPDFRAHYLLEKLGDYALADEGFARVAEELLERGAYDLFLAYLPGTDRVSHLAWGAYEAGKKGAVPFSGLVPAYYAYTDALLGRLLAKAGKDDTVIVLSDHGFKLREKAGPLTVVSGDHRPGGLFVAKGPELKKGARLAGPILDRDVAPTVLYLLGLPAARTMDGKLAEGIFRDGVLKARPQEYLDAYPAAAPRGNESLPFTPQELERLRLSGYLQ
ncbi:MAG: hypothetical protein A2X32_00750 [Elusimicrobia bacterium GWC2_64_44]|nr:MAG: hypothetical protein A2X32_00750 [Elusimicrobia bacterium GWC2_64_44]